MGTGFELVLHSEALLRGVASPRFVGDSCLSPVFRKQEIGDRLLRKAPWAAEYTRLRRVPVPAFPSACTSAFNRDACCFQQSSTASNLPVDLLLSPPHACCGTARPLSSGYAEHAARGRGYPLRGAGWVRGFT